MKQLVIIIGRAPPKINPNLSETEQVTWHVDLELNPSIPQTTPLPRQQAFIAYNFDKGHFEIKNLSENQEIYVNGDSYTYLDPACPLENSDMVQIGTEDFVFLLPQSKPTSQEEENKVEDVEMKEEGEGQG